MVGVVMKMAIFSVWLSILVRCGQKVIRPRQVVKCEWEGTFGILDLQEVSVVKTEISINEKFTDPVHIVPIDAPVSLTDQFTRGYSSYQRV